MAYKKSHIPNFPVLARAASAAARVALVDAMDEHAEDEKEDFVARIEGQRFASFKVILYPESGTNLSPQWLDFKESTGLDLRTMIATGRYVDQIRVFRRLGTKGSGRWRIGFHTQAKARKPDGSSAGILLNDLMKVHEHGTITVPARPHWGPFFNLMKRRAPAARREMRRRVLSAIKDAVGSKMVVKGGV